MKSNNLTERIVVVPGKVEEVSLPEQVDIIISEPMGYMLFNERMLESYLHAKKYLKPSGELRGGPSPLGWACPQHPEGAHSPPPACGAVRPHEPREGQGRLPGRGGRFPVSCGGGGGVCSLLVCWALVVQGG